MSFELPTESVQRAAGTQIGRAIWRMKNKLRAKFKQYGCGLSRA